MPVLKKIVQADPKIGSPAAGITGARPNAPVRPAANGTSTTTAPAPRLAAGRRPVRSEGDRARPERPSRLAVTDA